jgi:hypothetical protein
MQAVVSAFTAVHSCLTAFENDLTWFGIPYDELSLLIHVDDAGRRRRIQAILDEEQYSIDRSVARREQITLNVPGAGDS